MSIFFYNFSQKLYNFFLLFILISFPFLCAIGKNEVFPPPKSATLTSTFRPPLTLKQAVVSPSIQESLKKEIYSTSTVNHIKFQGQDGQSMIFWAAGLHEKDCRTALRKLSRYEDYKNSLGFLENSLYYEELKQVYFLINFPLFPVKLSLRFKIPRIEKEGVYPFVFEEGFLKDLKGEIHVHEEDNRCFFYLKSSWEGPDTGFSSTILEIFSKTVVKMGMERLFQISKY